MNQAPPGPTPAASPDPGATQPIPAADPAQPRWRDRLWSLRAVIAVALASVVIGGLGGAALAGVADHDDRRLGPGGDRFGRGGPPGFGGPRDHRRWPDDRGRGQRPPPRG